jgi:hypothetical protein
MYDDQLIAAIGVNARETLALELKRADLDERTHSKQRAELQEQINALYRRRGELRKKRHRLRGYYV